MKEITWAPAAQRDLRTLIAWYQQFDPAPPEELIDDIEAAAVKLIDFPVLGSPLPDSADRKWRAKGTPFILLYRPVRHGIRVLQVAHEATDRKKRR